MIKVFDLTDPDSNVESSPINPSNSLVSMRSRIKSLTGLNQAIGFSLLARGWQIAAGPVTLLFVAHYFNVTEQGFYYTFSSVLALQVLFELGLAFVINQFASHEFANLTWGYAGEIHGEKNAVNRIHLIIKKAIIWYGGVAFFMAILVLPAGLYFFSTNGSVGTVISWQGPWTALVLAASLYLPIIPILAAIEGSGHVAQINRLRLIQGIFSSLFTWIFIFYGAGLYAVVVTFSVNVLFSVIWIIRTYPNLLSAIRFKKKQSDHLHFSWRNEIWPMQWRIAVSWISGYFIFQLFTPILFYYHGPALAGQMGMSLVVANFVTVLPMIWLQANTPIMAKLIARANWNEFDRIFKKIFWQSALVSILGVVAIVAALWIFSEHPLIKRLLPIDNMVYLLLGFFLSHVIGALAHYLRMHKREPLMIFSVCGAILVAISMWYFGRLYGTTGMVLSLLIINLVYGLPSTIWLWFYLRKIWHQAVGQVYE